MKPPCPPKTACWCETHPNHPDCNVPAFTIESKVYMTGMLLLMIFWVTLLIKNKHHE